VILFRLDKRLKHDLRRQVGAVGIRDSGDEKDGEKTSDGWKP
jgi:hypothetical protein